jgi:hypothetical protein
LIVRSEHSSLYLITQPDHAALARRVMERWVPLHEAERRASILHAIAEHDNGWREPDDAPSVDPATGRVFDFITVPVAVRQGVWPRAVARLADDPWTAALVAQHAVTVYDRYRADPEWAHFFPQLEAIRDVHLRAAAGTLAELASDYVYVRLGDLISLAFCNRWTDALTFDRWTVQLIGDCVRVTPDAFDDHDIAIAVPARPVPDVLFASDEALRQALAASPLVWVRGLVSGAP